MEYRDQKSILKLSRYQALSLCAWLIITMLTCTALFYYLHQLNFKTHFTQITSYTAIYQKKVLIFSITSLFITLLSLIVYIRIFSFKTHWILKILLSIIPTIFVITSALLAFNAYLVLLELNIPFGQGIFAFRKYIQNFSKDYVVQAVATLPYQLDSIKLPLYAVIYSYLSMFTLIILAPLQLNFVAHSIGQKFNALLAIAFIILFSISAYYLGQYFIMHNPFLPYESLF